MISFWERIKAALRPTKKKAATTGGITAAVLALAIPLTERWEGMRTVAYQDVVNVWTVCLGETQAPGGGPILPGMSFTEAECREMLRTRLVEDYYEPLKRCAPSLVTAPVEVQAALSSWAYNVGVGAACKSTLVRKLEAGDLRGACNELPRWNRAGGKVWQGLVNRRADERGLCLSGLN